MNDTWNLDILYNDYNDPKFINDFKLMSILIDEFNDASNNNIDIAILIQSLEDISQLTERLACFCSLKNSVNTNDTVAVSYLNQLQMKLSNISKATTILNKRIADIQDLDSFLLANPNLNEYKYYLTRIKKDSIYLLSDEVENVLSKVSITSTNAFSKMQSFLCSTLEIEYNNKILNLSSIRNLAYQDSQLIRKEAYEKELEAYKKIADPISFALNSIKHQVKIECQLRNYESPVIESLNRANMSVKSLEALMKSIRTHLPKLQEYLKIKARLLNNKDDKLAWFDLFAPIGKLNKQYSLNDARDLLIDTFNEFNPNISKFIAKAFDNDWIDFYPRLGKEGGAFCCNMPSVKESRILTNYENNISDVITLAHELGHGYHGEIIMKHRPLNTDYSMPLAETASTFNECIITNKLIELSSDEDKIVLIENQLQDLCQIILDIYCRFIFEKRVFDKCENHFLSSKDLCELMIQCQKEAYGSALNHDYLHPYMWVNKSHYYSGSLSFYNYPYAFGGLFARGLYLKSKQNPDFNNLYDELLYNTTICSLEDVGKIAGIDLTDEGFYNDILNDIAHEIDEFNALSKKSTD